MKSCIQNCEFAQNSYQAGFERGYRAAKEVLDTLKGMELRSEETPVRHVTLCGFWSKKWTGAMKRLLKGFIVRMTRNP